MKRDAMLNTNRVDQLYMTGVYTNGNMWRVMQASTLLIGFYFI